MENRVNTLSTLHALCDSYELELYQLRDMIFHLMDVLDEAATRGTTIEILDVWKALNRKDKRNGN